MAAISKLYKEKGLHPTQKPVALFEYLIETYSKKGDIILDSCIGSGTTAIACMKTSRNYIGFENDATHYDCTMRRIEHFMAPNAR
ncbi:site-specific DNA-methyltransferase [Listeria newyorkensis]|uniref:site-specific DNA-methyltransferase n=1 Tax=Listeria newyorkensis TaxID=1497681 RepID=UPI00207B98C6|nr:site-specific DNA-methyltransferase [Listeria newyorkensis]